MAEKTVDAYTKVLPAEHRKIVVELRKVIKSAAPDATESIKWAQPVYEDHGPFAYIKAASQHITFGFWRGAELDGGRGLLETGGSRMAHIKLRTLAEVDGKRLTAFIRTAVRLNRENGDPTKRR